MIKLEYEKYSLFNRSLCRASSSFEVFLYSRMEEEVRKREFFSSCRESLKRMLEIVEKRLKDLFLKIVVSKIEILPLDEEN